jgi:hypothetical protein
MSETEYNVGTLTLVKIEVDAETTAKEILFGMGVKPDLTYFKTYCEQLSDEGYRRYYISEDKIYKVSYKDIGESANIFEATERADGVIEFQTRFYNGGCSFNEALDCAIKKVTL